MDKNNFLQLINNAIVANTFHLGLHHTTTLLIVFPEQHTNQMFYSFFNLLSIMPNGQNACCLHAIAVFQCCVRETWCFSYKSRDIRFTSEPQCGNLYISVCAIVGKMDHLTCCLVHCSRCRFAYRSVFIHPLCVGDIWKDALDIRDTLKCKNVIIKINGRV